MKGSILWFDQRDGRGIAVTSDGSEHYIDSSVIDRPELAHGGVRVTFETHMYGTFNGTRNVRIDLDSAFDRQLGAVASIEAFIVECGAKGLREGALEAAQAELARIERLIAEEECTHSDDTECGHCIDCGEYVGHRWAR